ncbi:MAG TPA: flagellar motor protein MotB [Verrucomicrobiae bacterium]|jgi:chemotaxis protein MotB|nr:flagellar motor protein MotB [Verrucomicrobiae bacterium]
MRKKPQPHVNHERWLVSYADFITLLFAFFVVLYSSSQVDKRKAGRLALAIQVAFQELGVFQTSNTKIPIKDEDAIPFQNVQVVENISKDTDLKRIVNPMKGTLSSASETQSLQEAQEAIKKALDPEIKRREVSMSMRREGLVVSLKEMGFFDSGSASIRPGSLDAIARLSAVLKTRPENLRIEGHTDDVPIHTPRFANNWELSTARATELIQLLITKYGIPPSHLSAAGYSEFHPVAGNTTPDGRAQNRRLDVVILAPFQPLPSPQPAEKQEVPTPNAQRNPAPAQP